MYELYIPYDKFPCQYILTTFFVIFSSAFLYIGYRHIAFALWYIVGRTPWAFPLAFYSSRPRRGFFRSLTTPHTQFSPRFLPISFRDVFSRLLFSSYAHAVGFSARILLLTPSFLPVTYPLASGVGFPACFSLPTPTPWVFPLTYYSSRPVFSLLPAYQLPRCVFPPANSRIQKTPCDWEFQTHGVS